MMNTSLSSLGWRNQSPSASMNPSINTSTQLNLSQSYTFKSKQCEYIMSEKTNFVLEPFGTPLPAMIRSLLNQMGDKPRKLSCRMDPNGWAWLVCGRKLYVWRHSFGHESKRNNVIPCRELILPTSELDHQAQLVCIVSAGGSGSSTSSPACIAVSPEGQITYWPNISNDSGTVTISADIPGQECESLYSLWPHACVLTTTTSTILLVKPCTAGGNKPTLTCSPVILAKGWLGLGGLGRKMSNMLFNPIPVSASADTKRSKIAIPISKDDPAQPGKKNPVIYILQGSTLQSWTMTESQQLNHLSSINLEAQIRTFFYEHVWSSAASTHKLDQLRRIQVLSLDVDVLPNLDVAVLAAAFDSTENHPLMHYGIVKLNPKEPEKQEFIPVDYNTPYVSFEDDVRSNEVLSWRVTVTSGYSCMMNNDTIVLTTGSVPECDILSASSCGGPFLGFGRITDNTIAVFSPKHGVLSLKIHIKDNLLDNTMIDNIRVPENLVADVTQYNFSDAMQTEDNVNRLKLAFLAFIGKRTTECESLIESILPENGMEWTPHESIDLIVLNLCEKLINDAPTPDPRGAGSYGSTLEPDLMGYKAKQLMHKCLNSKKEAVELYLGFLNNIKLLQQLTRVVAKEDVLATQSILYNYYEKLGFAMAIFHLLTDNNYHELVDAAIKIVVKYRSERDVHVRSSHLSVHEQFFKDVSSAHQFIKGVIVHEEGLLNKALPTEMVEVVCRANDVLLKAIADINVHMQEKIGAVKSSLLTPIEESPANPYEIRHWLVEPSTLQLLLRQHETIVTHGLKVTDDSGLKIKLLKELQDFTDLILTHLKYNLDSASNSNSFSQKKKFFEDTRHELLKQFVSLKDFERALGLAEKYQDFRIIISTCVHREEYDKLEYYFNKYEDQKFPELTFQWFVKQKRHNDLLTKFLSSSGREKLRVFLKNYPEMLWHFEVKLREKMNAANTLQALANSDGVSPEDRLLFLRLSKLGRLAAGVPPEEVDSMKEYDACNEGCVDIDRISNMTINERSEFSSVSQ